MKSLCKQRISRQMLLQKTVDYSKFTGTEVTCEFLRLKGRRSRIVVDLAINGVSVGKCLTTGDAFQILHNKINKFLTWRERH